MISGSGGYRHLTTDDRLRDQAIRDVERQLAIKENAKKLAKLHLGGLIDHHWQATVVGRPGADPRSDAPLLAARPVDVLSSGAR